MESAISRLVVLGATGNVGLPIVKLALARKLKVLAVSRNISKLEIKDENLQTASVDLQKEGALLDILLPDDTVIFCALDRAGGQDKSFKYSFKAFEEKGVKRIVHTGGITMLKIEDGRRLFETEEIQKKHPFYAGICKMQIEATEESKVNWTEVVFGVVIAGSKTPESGVAEFWGKEHKLIEFARPLEDIETTSIPLINHYIMSDFLAEKILDVASKQVYLRQRIAFHNGLFVPKN